MIDIKEIRSEIQSVVLNLLQVLIIKVCMVDVKKDPI